MKFVFYIMKTLTRETVTLIAVRINCAIFFTQTTKPLFKFLSIHHTKTPSWKLCFSESQLFFMSSQTMELQKFNVSQ